MIEEALVNYGVLGLWTASLLIERFRQSKRLNRIVENNTEALVRVHEVITKCKRK